MRRRPVSSATDGGPRFARAGHAEGLPPRRGAEGDVGIVRRDQVQWPFAPVRAAARGPRGSNPGCAARGQRSCAWASPSRPCRPEVLTSVTRPRPTVRMAMTGRPSAKRAGTSTRLIGRDRETAREFRAAPGCRCWGRRKTENIGRVQIVVVQVPLRSRGLGRCSVRGAPAGPAGSRGIRCCSGWHSRPRPGRAAARRRPARRRTAPGPAPMECPSSPGRITRSQAAGSLSRGLSLAGQFVRRKTFSMSKPRRAWRWSCRASDRGR